MAAKAPGPGVLLVGKLSTPTSRLPRSVAPSRAGPAKSRAPVVCPPPLGADTPGAGRVRVRVVSIGPLPPRQERSRWGRGRRSFSPWSNSPAIGQFYKYPRGISAPAELRCRCGHFLLFIFVLLSPWPEYLARSPSLGRRMISSQTPRMPLRGASRRSRGRWRVLLTSVPSCISIASAMTHLFSQLPFINVISESQR